MRNILHLAAGGLSLFVATQAAAAPQLFNVSNATELRAALEAARTIVGGADIRLRPGNYGTLVWNNRPFTLGRVSLVPATNNRPVFTGMVLTGAKGMSISGMQFTGSDRAVVNFLNSSDMIFAGNIVTGINHNADAWDDDSAGVYVRFSTRITVTQNLFEDLRAGTYIQRSSKVQFDHNTLRYIREGVNVAAADDLDITANYFHDFQPDVPGGEHPDSIQFWTAGETVGSNDVRLTENVMLHGGCSAVQGIFIRSETTGNPLGPQIRHSNFTLRNNIYYGASKHGMTLGSIDTVLAENNVIIASPYSDTGVSRAEAQAQNPRCSGALQPALLSLYDTTSHVIRRNVTTQQGSTDGQLSDNIVVGGTKGEPYTTVFRSRPTGTTPTLRSFLTKSPSIARTRQIGLLATFSAGQTLAPRSAMTWALSIHKE